MEEDIWTPEEIDYGLRVYCLRRPTSSLRRYKEGVKHWTLEEAKTEATKLNVALLINRVPSKR